MPESALDGAFFPSGPSRLSRTRVWALWNQGKGQGIHGVFSTKIAKGKPVILSESAGKGTGNQRLSHTCQWSGWNGSLNPAGRKALTSMGEAAAKEFQAGDKQAWGQISNWEESAATGSSKCPNEDLLEVSSGRTGLAAAIPGRR